MVGYEQKNKDQIGQKVLFLLIVLSTFYLISKIIVIKSANHGSSHFSFTTFQPCISEKSQIEKKLEERESQIDLLTRQKIDQTETITKLKQDLARNYNNDESSENKRRKFYTSGKWKTNFMSLGDMEPCSENPEACVNTSWDTEHGWHTRMSAHFFCSGKIPPTTISPRTVQP